MALVKFAIPKGSLEKATFEFLERGGYKISGQERTYRPAINDKDIELKLLRPQEIPVYVAEGLQDIGITGRDWIKETDADVETLVDLDYGRVKLVVAVPKSLPVNSLSGLLQHFISQNRVVRISTEFLNITSEYVKQTPIYLQYFGDEEPLIVTPWWRKGSNQKVSIFLSFGATEAKPPEDADAIVDLTETGTTLEQNDLKPIETVYQSSAVLVANRSSLTDPVKRVKIYDILTLARGVVDARKKLHIFVNVRKENIDELLSHLPALKRPTISPLSDPDWYSVNTVVDRDIFLKLLPVLRRLAQGLVVHEPKQIIPLEEVARREDHDRLADKNL